MKLRNVNISTLILLTLLFSSCAFFVTAQENATTQENVFMDSDQDGLADSEEKIYGTDAHNSDTDKDSYSDGSEVEAGYDPLKPAPGDRLSDNQDNVAEQLTLMVGDEVSPTGETGENLTTQVAQKISGLANQSDSDDPQASLDEIQQIVNETLGSQGNTVELPQIDRETIRIKEQDYSESEAKERMKEDFSTYIATIFYIFTSNSPTPITSSSDITSSMTQVMGQLVSAISTQDPTVLSNISKSGKVILEQLKEVEVPEDMVDLHINAMQYAIYAEGLEEMINPNPDDPLSSVVNFSKIGVFVQSLSSFSTDAQSKLDEYDVDYNDIQDKMKGFGVELPGLEELSAVTTTTSTDSDEK